jgi:hypothetical protein
MVICQQQCQNIPPKERTQARMNMPTARVYRCAFCLFDRQLDSAEAGTRWRRAQYICGSARASHSLFSRSRSQRRQRQDMPVVDQTTSFQPDNLFPSKQRTNGARRRARLTVSRSSDLCRSSEVSVLSMGSAVLNDKAVVREQTLEHKDKRVSRGAAREVLC